MVIFLNEIVLCSQERYYYDNYEDIQISQRIWQKEYLKEKRTIKSINHPKKYNHGSFVSNCCTSMDR